MQSLIDSANSFSIQKEKDVLASPSSSKALLFRVQGTLVGLVHPQVAQVLLKYGDVFCLKNEYELHFIESLRDSAARTERVNDTFLKIKALNLFKCLSGWRNEKYCVLGKESQELFAIERSAAGLLGVRSYGCHLNGYTVDDATGEMKMWVAKRSRYKQTFPSFLDNIAGGGLPSHLFQDPHKNIIKEAFEEASIPAQVASRSVFCGSISFWNNDESNRGWLADTEYVYDLRLRKDFIPCPNDNEVESFSLMDFKEIGTRLQNGEFMIESGLVILDFMVRHGIINEGTLEGLHRKFPFP